MFSVAVELWVKARDGISRRVLYFLENAKPEVLDESETSGNSTSLGGGRDLGKRGVVVLGGTPGLQCKLIKLLKGQNEGIDNDSPARSEHG
jgi:hypothetical protein